MTRGANIRSRVQHGGDWRNRLERGIRIVVESTAAAAATKNMILHSASSITPRDLLTLFFFTITAISQKDRVLFLAAEA